MSVSATYIILQRAIADELGDRSDLLGELSGSGLASSPIKRAIQSAIAKWEREQFYFNEGYEQPLFTTIVGQEFYDVDDDADILSSPDIWSLHALIGGNRSPMERRSWDYMEQISPGPAHRGQPTEWSYLASQIRLYPIPGGVYPIRASCTKRLAALAADNDTNAWTTDAFDLIRSEAKLVLSRDVLQDTELEGKCMTAIYGNPTVPRDTGYCGALKAETMRRARSGKIKSTQF